MPRSSGLISLLIGSKVSSYESDSWVLNSIGPDGCSNVLVENSFLLLDDSPSEEVEMDGDCVVVLEVRVCKPKHQLLL